MTDLARIDVEQYGLFLVARIEGEVDVSNVGELGGEIEDAVPNSARGLVVDLTRTEYLDSAGIALLVRLAERLRARRQELRLLVPPGAPVRAVLELTALPKMMRVDARLDQALTDGSEGER